jgi:hypothetical protein
LTIGLITLVVLLTVSYKYFLTVSHVDVIITEKSDKLQKYLIYTVRVKNEKEVETFEITDDKYFFNFNSSDKYGILRKEKKYRLKVQGIRLSYLSWYRNIVRIDDF